MSRINDVLRAFQGNIVSVVNQFAPNYSAAQCIIGWPNFEDLTKIIQQGQYLASIYDTGKASDTSRFYPSWMKVQDPNVPLTASISGNVLTFGGSVAANLNVHTLVASPLQDTLYQTVGADTLNTIASGVAAKINALGISGLSAVASTNHVTVTGSANLKCNVGGSTTLAREIARHRRQIQVTLWCPTPAIRANVGEIISANVGVKGLTTKFIPMPDGTNVWAEWMSSVDTDEKQANYSIYARHFMYALEYGIMQTSTATQIGAVQETYTLNNGTALPAITEG